jgi:alpha-glucosidase
MKFQKIIIEIHILIIILFFNQVTMANNMKLQSPDSLIEINIDITDTINYSVSFNKKEIILPSPISMIVEKRGKLGEKPELLQVRNDSADRILKPVAPVKNKKIRDNYNETILDFKGSYSIAFRAYNDGIAYRFITDVNGTIKVDSEEVCYNLPKGVETYFPTESNFVSHNEAFFENAKLKDINGKQGILPILLLMGNDARIVITEADIRDYAGLYLCVSGDSLIGRFPNRVLEYSTNEKGLDSTIT